jgi:oligopeptide/dipeptide ABC transporter ATP-binding protein
MRVDEALAAVGLRPEHLSLYPHEVSGGQQRRVGLARVLTLQPKLLILDEPTSGLDVSVQATILKLLLSLWRQYGLTLIFISHDLAVVRSICTRVAVMYLGRIVEIGPAAGLFERPRHPYTKSLLAAVPIPGGRRVIDEAWLEGEPPNPLAIPSGCRFRNRCPMAAERCAAAEPPLRTLANHHQAACHFAE